jgi:hypothetical protein
MIPVPRFKSIASTPTTRIMIISLSRDGCFFREGLGAEGTGWVSGITIPRKIISVKRLPKENIEAAAEPGASFRKVIPAAEGVPVGVSVGITGVSVGVGVSVGSSGACVGDGVAVGWKVADGSRVVVGEDHKVSSVLVAVRVGVAVQVGVGVTVSVGGVH